MVRWNVCSVVLLCVFVVPKGVSTTEAPDTGSTPLPPITTVEGTKPSSSVGATDVTCDKCIHGYCSGGKCLCHPGWTSVSCDSDINECETGHHHCHRELGVCANTLGSYSCTCKEGNNGDGINCKAPLFRYAYDKSSPRQGDDKVYGPYRIYGGLAYFGHKYRKFYVSTNGYISLHKKYNKVNPFADNSFPRKAVIIAPYWTDLDMSHGAGALYINVHSELDQSKERAKIFTQFKSDAARWCNVSFSPTFVLVATWEKARAYPVFIFNESESVSFQAVLGTDSNQSCLLLEYGAGSMRWGSKVQWSKHPILLGYTDFSAQGRHVKVSDIYRPDLDSNIGAPGKYMYRLGSTITNHDMACLRWALVEDKREAPPSPPPCPCSILHMESRYRRVTGDCYVFRSMDIDNRILPKDKFAPCCYNSAGMLLPARLVLQANDSRVDTFVSPAYRPAYDACCVKSSLCHVFYKRYHDYTCDEYLEPVYAMVNGYMTFKTWHREVFSRPVAGQFVLTGVNNGSFVIQMRAGPPVSNFTETPNVTVPIAFAAKDFESERFELRWTADGDAALHVGGKPAGTMRHQPVGVQTWHKGLSIERLHETGANRTEDVVVFFNATRVALRFHQMLGRLSIILAQEGLESDEMEALLDVHADEFDKHLIYSLRNGSNCTVEDMFTDWEVRADESLFTYSIDTAINKHFLVPKLYFEKLVKQRNGTTEEFCWEPICCTAYSVAEVFVGNDNFTWATHVEEYYFEYRQHYIVENRAPVFESEPAIRVVAGQRITVVFEAHNAEGIFEFRLETNIPAEQYSFDVDTGAFDWTPSPQIMDGVALYLRVLAVDDYELQSLSWPTLEVCACMNQGKCSFDILATEQHPFSSRKFYLADCECTEGFTGRFCKQRVDMCQPNSCYHDNACSASSTSHWGYTCASCPKGLGGNGMKCGACTHPGFHLLDNGTCADVDECKVECKGLGQYCVNTMGSFECRCHPEYVISTSGVVCLFAPKRYYASLTFGVMETEEGYVSYSREMKDTGSELYKTVVENVVHMITGVLEGVGLVAAHVAKISHSDRQTPVVHVKLYFLQEASVDVKKLESYFQKRDYRQHTDKLIGVSGLTFKEWDTCEHVEDNTCDVTTTTCVMTDGRFTCVCKDGFHNLSPNNSCKDVCSDHPCENGGTCDRQKHTYQCKCPDFWLGRHCTVNNEPAIRYRSSTIALGAAFGVVSLTLLVALLATVVRNAADRKRIRRTQISFRRKQSKEDQLNDAGASIQVDETSGQHQSPGGKNDKSNDAQHLELSAEAGEENHACSVSTSQPHRLNSRKIKGPCQTEEPDTIDIQADI